MANRVALQLPIVLPEGWSAVRRWPQDDKVIVIFWLGRGSVTIDLRRRNFALSATLVHRSNKKKYAGTGWEKKLFQDAVSALRDAGNT